MSLEVLEHLAHNVVTGNVVDAETSTPLTGVGRLPMPSQIASARVVHATEFTPSNAGAGWFKMADLCPYNVSSHTDCTLSNKYKITYLTNVSDSYA